MRWRRDAIERWLAEQGIEGFAEGSASATPR
jgi:hypothetical protein